MDMDLSMVLPDGLGAAAAPKQTKFVELTPYSASSSSAKADNPDGSASTVTLMNTSADPLDVQT